MARRSTSSTRTLVPLETTEWQDEDAQRADQSAEDDADENDATEIDSDVAVDLDEGDDLAIDDTAVLAVADGIVGGSADVNVESLVAELDIAATPATRQATRRTSGAARRQVEDYWEQRRMARALEDLEDFEV